MLTMKADAKSYPNEKNMWDSWRKTQSLETWSDLVIAKLPHELLSIYNYDVSTSISVKKIQN